MSAGFIGGDLATITASGEKMNSTGDEVAAAGNQTEIAAGNLTDDIDAAMVRVTNAFNDIAGEITTLITANRAQLEQADWSGSSRDAAANLEADLTTQINTVVTEATTTLNQEQTQFNARANVVLTEVGQRFHGLMTQANEQYTALGQAVNQTAQNFSEADRTISV